MMSNDFAIDPMTAQTVLNFDNPKVRVPLRLTRDIGIGLSFGHQFSVERFEPTELTIKVSYLTHDPAAGIVLVDF